MDGGRPRNENCYPGNQENVWRCFVPFLQFSPIKVCHVTDKERQRHSAYCDPLSWGEIVGRLEKNPNGWDNT
jgi:hypothetical protein